MHPADRQAERRPGSVAQKLSAANGTRAEPEVGEQRLGDEAQAVGAARERGDHRGRRDADRGGGRGRTGAAVGRG